MIPLPPKRFQPVDDPRYDAIRFRPWFRSLAERRAKLPMLRQAYLQWSNGLELTQKAAAEAYGVDERELRDYVDFILGVCRVPEGNGKQFRGALDHAQMTYIHNQARNSFTKELEQAARIFGLKPRHLVEVWEVDSTFYPTLYPR
jgi:hypothetical protein